MCVTSIYEAGTDDYMYVTFYYSSTSGKLITSDAIELDNAGCDDFEEGNCDYFDVVP